MCGIFGVFFDDSALVPDRKKLSRSTSLLDHRGPDAMATHCDYGIGLGHTRLSFVDVYARSNQPFWDESRRYLLAFNGEIYNFRELKAQLQAEGVTFRTASDTEVVLEMLLHRSPVDALCAFEGMFALALFDSKERTLLLARDRFGMKPLFVHEDNGRFLFSSEVKAFRPWIDVRADRFTVASYLLNYSGPTNGKSFFENITAVEPGQMVVKEVGCPSKADYFARLEHLMTEEALCSYRRFSPSGIVDHIEELLSTSVTAHLLADVPVGAFCSGGVDSSLIMAMAAREHNNLAIFHANVKGRWSEFEAASALAQHLRLDMRSTDIEEQDFIDLIPRTVAHFEQPFAETPNCIPMMRVAELAKENGVKGLLSGEGSDECFLGYPWLGRKRLTDSYYSAGRKLSSLVRAIPGLGEILAPPPDKSGAYARELMSGCEMVSDNRRIREATDAMQPHGANKHHAWTLEYLHHHLRILLHRNDTMGMAASIESRFPFLHTKMVSAAVNMPGAYKLRRDITMLDRAHPFIRDKWVVRQVASRYIPQSLSQRTKFGFWTTVFDRFQIDPAYFHDSWIGSVAGLTNTQLDSLLDSADVAFKVRLLHVDMWGRVCCEQESEDSCIARLRRFVDLRPE